MSCCGVNSGIGRLLDDEQLFYWEESFLLGIKASKCYGVNDERESAQMTSVYRTVPLRMPSTHSEMVSNDEGIHHM
ncbi:hypothetical protein EYF80_051572 [Liparis tanakae]|uniref:Uncharacterized protein n=1 Tax=Liparis tanakae TaxID=230148 RepID=A0A4Z2FAN2_9TELE|nr:hypothetical protein EYF80_051572 [Liparis tanakae]